MKPVTEPWLIGLAIVFFLCVTSLAVSYFMGDSALYDAVGAATSRTVNRGVPGLDEEAAKLVMMTKEGGIEKNYYVNNEHGSVQVNAPWYGPVFQQMFSNVDWDALEMTAKTEAASASE